MAGIMVVVLNLITTTIFTTTNMMMMIIHDGIDVGRSAPQGPRLIKIH